MKNLSNKFEDVCSVHSKRSQDAQLNVDTRTDFTVGCMVKSFDLCPGSEPGFFEGRDQRNKKYKIYMTVKSVLVPTFKHRFIHVSVMKIYEYIIH